MGTGVIVITTSGYAAEVASICAALDRPVACIVGSGGAMTAAPSLGIESQSWTGAVSDLPLGPVAVALGDSAERQAVCEALREAGREPETLIHPATTIGLGVHVGAGCLVSPGAIITGNVTIGTATLIHTGAILSHDDVVGSYATISPAVTVTGGVTIEDRAWIAAGATLLPGVTIGADAVVGAGALVTKDVATGTTVAGVPAKPIG